MDARRHACSSSSSSADASTACIPTAARRPSPSRAAARTGSRSVPTARCTSCNSGGWDFHEIGDFTIPETELPAHHSGGRIERVDLATGDVTVLYTECDGHPLIGPERPRVRRARRHVVHRPRQIREGRVQHVGAIYYAQPDGSSIREVVFPSESPNGIGLSPDGDAPVRRRDAHRPRVRVERDRARARSSATRRARRARCSAGCPGCSCSTRSASTATATSWSRRSSPAALTVIAPDGEVLDQVDPRRPAGHQRLLRRRRPAHRLRDLLRDRPPRAVPLAPPRPRAQLLTSDSHVIALAPIDVRRVTRMSGDCVS